MRSSALISALLLAACGSGGGGHGGGATDLADPAAARPSSPAADPTHSLLVDDASKLPACDASAEGWLVYLKAEAKFQACTAGAWADVTIKGPKGDKGDTGAAGAAQATVTQAVAALKKVGDSGGVTVGFAVDGQGRLGLLNSNASVPFTDPAVGFAQGTAADYEPACYYMNSVGSCTGLCVVLSEKPVYLGGASVLVPTGKGSYSNASAFQPTARRTLQNTCDTAVTADWPTLSPGTHPIWTTAQKDYTLPFELTAP